MAKVKILDDDGGCGNEDDDDGRGKKSGNLR